MYSDELEREMVWAMPLLDGYLEGAPPEIRMAWRGLKEAVKQWHEHGEEELAASRSTAEEAVSEVLRLVEPHISEHVYCAIEAHATRTLNN